MTDDTLMTADSEIDRLRADLLTARCEVEDLSGEVAQLRGVVQTLVSGPPVRVRFNAGEAFISWFESLMKAAHEALGDG